MKWYYVVAIALVALLIGIYGPKLWASMKGTSSVPVLATPPVGSTVAVTTNTATGAKILKVV